MRDLDFGDYVVNYTKNDRDHILHFLLNISYTSGDLSINVSPTAQQIVVPKILFWFLTRYCEADPTRFIAVDVDESFIMQIGTKMYKICFISSMSSTGSVMLLISEGNNSRLITGNFCFSEEIFKNEAIKEITSSGTIDSLYFDSTLYDTDARLKSIDNICFIFASVVLGTPKGRNIIVLIKMGLEFILPKVMLILRSRRSKDVCYVDKHTLEAVERMGFGCLFTNCTQKGARAKIFVHTNLLEIRRSFGVFQDCEVIRLVPQPVWNPEMTSYMKSRNTHVFQLVPHSSRDQCDRLIKLLKPKNLTPIVSTPAAHEVYCATNVNQFFGAQKTPKAAPSAVPKKKAKGLSVKSTKELVDPLLLNHSTKVRTKVKRKKPNLKKAPASDDDVIFVGSTESPLENNRDIGNTKTVPFSLKKLRHENLSKQFQVNCNPQYKQDNVDFVRSFDDVKKDHFSLKTVQKKTSKLEQRIINQDVQSTSSSNPSLIKKHYSIGGDVAYSKVAVTSNNRSGLDKCVGKKEIHPRLKSHNNPRINPNHEFQESPIEDDKLHGFSLGAFKEIDQHRQQVQGIEFGGISDSVDSNSDQSEQEDDFEIFDFPYEEEEEKSVSLSLSVKSIDSPQQFQPEFVSEEQDSLSAEESKETPNFPSASEKWIDSFQQIKSEFPSEEEEEENLAEELNNSYQQTKPEFPSENEEKPIFPNASEKSIDSTQEMEFSGFSDEEENTRFPGFQAKDSSLNYLNKLPLKAHLKYFMSHLNPTNHNAFFKQLIAQNGLNAFDFSEPDLKTTKNMSIKREMSNPEISIKMRKHRSSGVQNK